MYPIEKFKFGSSALAKFNLASSSSFCDPQSKTQINCKTNILIVNYSMEDFYSRSFFSSRNWDIFCKYKKCLFSLNFFRVLLKVFLLCQSNTQQKALLNVTSKWQTASWWKHFNFNLYRMIIFGMTSFILKKGPVQELIISPPKKKKLLN